MAKKKRKKKKKPLPPRAKRMNRQGRLQSARSWLKKYRGKRIVRSYRKHYGVDWECAFKELEMLGVEIDPGYIEQVRETLQVQREAKERKKKKKAERERRMNEEFLCQNEYFAFIAGYTSGGAPFGITWEEWDGPGREEEDDEIDPGIFDVFD